MRSAISLTLVGGGEVQPEGVLPEAGQAVAEVVLRQVVGRFVPGCGQVVAEAHARAAQARDADLGAVGSEGGRPHESGPFQ